MLSKKIPLDFFESLPFVSWNAEVYKQQTQETNQHTPKTFPQSGNEIIQILARMDGHLRAGDTPAAPLRGTSQRS